MNSTSTSSAPASPTTEELVQRCLAISRILCAIALVLPAWIVVGKIFDIPVLTHRLSALPAMRPNTAVGLTLTALSILFTPSGSSRPLRRSTIASLLAFAVLLLGLVTMSEYIVRRDWGVDQLLINVAQTANEPFPGRPSLQTSVNFALLGAVLLSMNLGHGPPLLGQTGAILVGGNSIAVVTAYLFGSTELEFAKLGEASGIVVETAIAFALLVAALLCRRPTEGMMTLVTSDTLSGLMARRVLLAGIVAPPLVGALTRLGVALGWYDVQFERALFVLALVTLIVRATWRAARHAERVERQAQAAQVELDRTREEWASIVAHDLRQPISTIVLRTSMLQRTSLNDGQRTDVQDIRVSADHLSRMVMDLTDAALLESGHLSVTLDRIDLAELLRVAVQRVPMAAARTHVDVPPDCEVFIKGDAQRLEQVVKNLLTNGVKYSEPGTPIELALTWTERNAEFTVANHGQGIPPDEIVLVFERYVRSRAIATRKTKGLGLGLYICKGIIEAHGGRIWADSVPGDVTTFHVSIPLDGPPVPVDSTPEPEPIGAATR
jgi:signal transduction histidine kinase